MCICIKYAFKFSRLYTGKVLFFVSLLFVMVLASSPLVYVFSNNLFPFVSGTSSKVGVSNEIELRNEINNALKDQQLSNLTMTSNSQKHR